MRIGRLFWLASALALGSCGFASITDEYGNSYGGYYNPGSQFQWQLAGCQQEILAGTIPLPARKLAMRCCMWRHGVPIDDPQSCTTSTG